jgi:hypothetical protein
MAARSMNVCSGVDTEIPARRVRRASTCPRWDFRLWRRSRSPACIALSTLVIPDDPRTGQNSGLWSIVITNDRIRRDG